MQKKFGQNFLLNEQVRIKIVDALCDYKNVFEIGPGLGAITYLLKERCEELTLFEIDKGFIAALKELYSEIKIVEGDALKTLLPSLKEKKPTAVIGNLPYNVGSQIIGLIIESGFLPNKMVFTLQKEVISRMSAKIGEKNYSSFTFLCNLDYEVKKICDISAGSFFPPPSVTSSVVVLSLKEESKKNLLNEEYLRKRKIYFKIVSDLFFARRKTFSNNVIKNGTLSKLPASLALELCSKAGIDPSLRGEAIDYKKIFDLATLLEAQS